MAMQRTGFPAEIFCSYASADEELYAELEKHLSELVRRGEITLWHQGNTAPGDERTGERVAHLNSAAIILLLITADFMASNSCSTTR